MFSIIIPIFNESENIEYLVNEIYDSLQKDKHSTFELILVNDCSSDNTIEVLKLLKKKFDFNILNNNSNKGQSFSIFKGISEAKHNTIVTLDGDGQNDPKNISLLLEKYFSDPNLYLVGGIRNNRKDSSVKILSSRIANQIRSHIFNDGCADTGCSLKVFDRKVFLKFPFFTGIHRFLPALFRGYGYGTAFLNVDHRPRTKGKSKYGTLDRLYRGIIDIIKVKKILKHKSKKL